MRLRIGSRGSQLALWQANYVSGRLRERGFSVEIEIIRTTGDKITDVALAQVGTKGMFTKEIEEALAAGHIDLAVHSLKDLPTDLPGGFALAAVTERQDARDALLSLEHGSLDELPRGARVGTSSLRRQAQLKAVRPDIECFPLRGNVDTRLRKLEAGEFHAIILAAAGVARLGLTRWVRQFLPVKVMCPAAGQGALAIEVRADDADTLARVAFLNDAATRAAVSCERAILRALGGGCQVPIGAHATLDGQTVHATGVVARPDGSAVLRETRSGHDAVRLGEEIGAALRRAGGEEILREVYGSGAAAPQQP